MNKKTARHLLRMVASRGFIGQAIFVLTIFALGCASAPPEPATAVERKHERVAANVNQTVELFHDTEAHDTEVAAARSAVWESLLAVHEQLGIPLASMDQPAGKVVYFTPNLGRMIAGKRASYYVDCGLGPGGQARADSYRLTLSIGEQVDSLAAQRTRLRTALEATARSSGTASEGLHCNTTGQLEKLVAAMTIGRLKQ